VKPRAWCLLAIGAAAFFALQVLSQLLLLLGGVYTDAALVLKPLDGDIRYQAMRQAQHRLGDQWNVGQMRAALGSLQGAIQRNPFHYLAWFERFQVLQTLETLGEDTSDTAIQALQGALLLRSKDPHVAFAGMRFTFSRWPLFQEQEKAFFNSLFPSMARVIRRNDFVKLLETWRRYSRDLDLLRIISKERPEFNREVAQTLATIQLHLDARQRFLASYEAWRVEHFGKELRERVRNGRDNYDTWKYIVRMLTQYMQGFSHMFPDTLSTYREYTHLVDKLQLNMVAALSGSMVWSTRASSRKEVLRLAGEMLEHPAEPSVLKQLYSRLENTRFFIQADLQILELRLRLLLEIGESANAQSLGAAQVAERHYVPPDEAAAVRRIFILYSRALQRLGQVDEALRVVTIARERTGNDLSLDWEAFRLNHPGKIDPQSEVWQNLPGEIRDSSRLPLRKGRRRYTVFPPPDNQLLVAATQDVDAILAGKHLVQVFANDLILAERYAKDFQPGMEWRIPLPEIKDKLPVKIEVRVK